MDSKLSIAFVTSEMRPFAATGGLGDVAGALPKALSELGHDVRVIMPGYAMIRSQGYELRDVPGLESPLFVPNLGSVHVATAMLPGSDVPVYFLEDVDADFFRRTTDRSQLYGWPDDDKRFILLCRGTMELLYAMGWKPDVIHCNDWQAGLIPSYLDTLYKFDFMATASLYTTHNLLYSGPGGLSTQTLWQTGLGRHLIPLINPHEYYGQFNFAKGGLMVADVVNTVSPTYADEVVRPESVPLRCSVRVHDGASSYEHTCRIPNGGGFHAVLRHRRKHLPFLGILNGIDTVYWDPGNDPFLELDALRALAESVPKVAGVRLPDAIDDVPAVEDPVGRLLARKARYKECLQKLCGLDADRRALLIGRVARIGDQKDFLLMAEEERALKGILEVGCQLVILGRASAQDVAGQWYRRVYERFDREHPGQLCYINSRWSEWLGRPLPVDADFEFEHLVYAGSDAFLLPSLYEPCGLSQMISFRYGTVPIVRRTGGLADTVRDHAEKQDDLRGGGFVFDQASPEALVDVVRRARDAFQGTGSAWTDLAREGMAMDFSWRRSAREYAQAYRLAMDVRRKRNNLR